MKKSWRWWQKRKVRVRGSLDDAWTMMPAPPRGPPWKRKGKGKRVKDSEDGGKKTSFVVANIITNCF